MDIPSNSYDGKLLLALDKRLIQLTIFLCDHCGLK